MDATTCTNVAEIWRSYQQLKSLLDRLPTFTRQVVERVMSEGVTEELRIICLNAPDAEWDRYQIVRIIGGANPEHPEYATETALDEVCIGLGQGELP